MLSGDLPSTSLPTPASLAKIHFAPPIPAACLVASRPVLAAEVGLNSLTKVCHQSFLAHTNWSTFSLASSLQLVLSKINIDSHEHGSKSFHNLAILPQCTNTQQQVRDNPVFPADQIPGKILDLIAQSHKESYPSKYLAMEDDPIYTTRSGRGKIEFYEVETDRIVKVRLHRHPVQVQTGRSGPRQLSQRRCVLLG